MIKKAILPVAGFGTRFLPATKAQPKEMLPIYDTPSIQFIIEELVASGITDIIIVTGKGKRSIEDHFDANFELEFLLQEKGKTKDLELVKKLSSLANISYVRQHKPLGDGHAILCAKNFIKDEPFIVCFGDDIVDNPGGENSITQLINIFEKKNNPVVLLEKIATENLKKYGVVELDQKTEKIKNIVEKPDPKKAPSNLGIIGKYILTPEILDILEKIPPGKDGEIRLSNAFFEFIKNNGALYGKILDGVRFDTGDKLGFLQATLYFALKKEPKLTKKVLDSFLKN